MRGVPDCQLLGRDADDAGFPVLALEGDGVGQRDGKGLAVVAVVHAGSGDDDMAGVGGRQAVGEGLEWFVLAAHAGDVARGLPGARDWDDAMADARGTFDWKLQFELAIDGDEARRRYEKGRDMTADDSDYCSMCGRDFCAMRNSQQIKAG